MGVDRFLHGLLWAGFVGAAAAFGTLAVAAFAHLRMRLLTDFFRDVSRQVDKLEQLKKTGAETPLLWKYQEMQGLLRRMLQKHGLLPPAPK